MFRFRCSVCTLISVRCNSDVILCRMSINGIDHHHHHHHHHHHCDRRCQTDHFSKKRSPLILVLSDEAGAQALMWMTTSTYVDDHIHICEWPHTHILSCSYVDVVIHICGCGYAHMCMWSSTYVDVGMLVCVCGHRRCMITKPTLIHDLNHMCHWRHTHIRMCCIAL